MTGKKEWPTRAQFEALKAQVNQGGGGAGVQLVDALVDLPAGRMGRLRGEAGALFVREEDGRLFRFAGTFVEEEPVGGGTSYWQTMSAYTQVPLGDGTTIVSLVIPGEVNQTADALGLRIVTPEDIILLEQYLGIPATLEGLPLGQWSATQLDVGQPAGVYAYIIRLADDIASTFLWSEVELQPY